MASPREVIEDIRRNSFGIGLPHGSPERRGFDSLRPMLDRAIQHLSDDLYTQDIHFVLELVQNADDNSYHHGVTPFIRFTHLGHTLLVQNNEVGFSEPNVRALCNIGNSSKSKDEGQIGEKGIGFKSVFRVSDQPLVASNGYQFQFRRKDAETGLGFIVPEWVEVPECVDASLTNIVLPLKHQAGDEAGRISRLAPDLLLFLNKVRRIEVHDRVRGTVVVNERIDHPGRVELRSDDWTAGFRLVSQGYDVPPDARDEKRKDVVRSTVVLAFPLALDGRADASEEQEVYAFLPVGSYGLRFGVHADFVLSSNRESILADRAWNLWLRNCIAPQFLFAVAAFRGEESGLRNTFLNYLLGPEPDEPFSTVRKETIRGLKQTECILTAAGRWVRPEDVVIDSFGLRDLLTNDDVEKLLGVPYVASEFEIPNALVESLGVQEFTLGDLLECLGNTDWLKTKGDSWLATLFARLATTVASKADVEQFRTLSLVPLEDGTFASPKARRLFLPLPASASYGFEDRVPVVRKSLLTTPDEQIKKGAEVFLRTLGVRKANPADLISDYILPLFASDDKTTNWQAANDGFRIGAVAYIKDHLEAYSQAGHELDRLQDELRIRFAHPEGSRYVPPSRLYLPACYGNESRLEDLLTGIQDVRFVHEVYLTHGLDRLARRRNLHVDDPEIQGKRLTEVVAWRTFFTQIGVETVPRVVPRPSDTEPDQADSPDLERVFATADPERILQVARLILTHWDTYREHLVTPFMVLRRRSWFEDGRRRTKFGKLLADTDWLPTESGKLCRPSRVFVGSPETRAVLDQDVQYLHSEITDPRVIGDLEINKQPTVSSVLSRLRRLAQAQVSDAKAYQRIYEFLEAVPEQRAAEFVPAFGSEGLIYAPGGPPRWLAVGATFWDEAGKIFGSARVGLARHWPSLKRFFVDRLRVPAAPATRDYAERLRELAAAGKIAGGGEGVIWDIYKELERRLAADPDLLTDVSWWDEIRSTRVFWTTRAEFRASNGSLFVDDRKDLSALFSDKAEVGFLKLPPNSHPLVKNFLAAAGIELLSTASRIEPPASAELQRSPGLTTRCRAVVPFVTRYLFFREHAKYRELVESGQMARLHEVEVHVCDDLCVTVLLGGASVAHRQPVASRFPCVYVRRDAVDDLDRIAVELSGMIGGSQGLATFIAATLSREEAEATERLMGASQIPDLPADVALSNETVSPSPASPTLDDQRTITPNIPDGGTMGDQTADVDDSDGESEVLNREQRQPAVQIQGETPPTGDRPVNRPVHLAPRTTNPPVPVQQQFTRSTGPAAAPAELTHGGQLSERRISGAHSDGVPVAPWSATLAPNQAPTNLLEVTPRAAPRRTPPTGTAPSQIDRDPDRTEGEVEPPASAANLNAVLIGTWGEEYVLCCLRDEVSARHPSAVLERVVSGFRFSEGGVVVAEVQWLNYERDMGVGCDILLQEGTTSYVEVKTTADENRTTFDITQPQWDTAREHGPTYCIVRVFNGGTPRARSEVYRDPYRLWQEGRLSARPIRVVL